MIHKNYFEIEAANTYELGLRKGKLFGEFLHTTLEEERKDDSWDENVEQSQAYLDPTAEVFPNLIDELQGYARGADASFDDLWTLNLLDELTGQNQEKCTTFVTNKGLLIAHNEDWSADAKDELCILRRTVGDVTTFELFYLNTLGGNAVSVNSHGVAQTTNSLDHVDHQIGIPKNVVARWMSDSSSPDHDCETLVKLKRASGYHHTLVDSFGKVWSIECSAKTHSITKPQIPFVHTNHFVTPELSGLEGNDDRFGTFCRYSYAGENVTDTMSTDSAQRLLGDSSQGKRKSIHSNRTIGGIVLDVGHMRASVWLRREKKKGWISYSMNF